MNVKFSPDAMRDFDALPGDVQDEIIDLYKTLRREADPRSPHAYRVDVCICYPVAPKWHRAKFAGGRGRSVFSIRRDGYLVEPGEPLRAGDVVRVEFCAQRARDTYYVELAARVG